MMLKTISTIIILPMTSIILSTPAVAYQTSVSVNAPESVDSDFSVVIEIENAVDLDSGQFDLSFNSSVVRREEPIPEETTRMMRLFSEMAIEVLGCDDFELFTIERKTITLPEYSPIFAAARCSICGENIMKTGVRIADGKPICIPCAGDEHYATCGDGIYIER